jgi:hypothetical protein
MAKPPGRSKAFDEVQAPFAGAAGLRDFFAAYGHACAFTGTDLSREIAADPLLAVVRLSSLEAPAHLHFDLILPAIPAAAYAYERGHLAIGPRFNFLLDWSRIDQTFARRLTSALRLPASPEFMPNLNALREHREAFAAGAFPQD